jgi:GNAT superfamily N-acetyltransferase
MTPFTIRTATPDDAPMITAHRRGMFIDMGHADQATLDQMCAEFEPWVCERLAQGEYRAWLAVAEVGAVVAGVGLWLTPWPSSAIYPGSSGRPYALNVYTDSDYRRKGLARQLMQTMLDWCRQEGYLVINLHASEQGRPLYEHLGFIPSNEMRRRLNPLPIE